MKASNVMPHRGSYICHSGKSIVFHPPILRFITCAASKNVDHTGSLLTAENMSQPGGDGSDGDGGYTADLIRPIITCMSDTDSRVRYYACESLYNVTKVIDIFHLS